MRRRFLQLYDTSISEIHAVSAFGTSVAFYSLSKNDNDKLKPVPAAHTTDEHLADVAPQEWWSHNILDPQGYAKFVQVVEVAKTGILIRFIGVISSDTLTPPGLGWLSRLYFIFTTLLLQAAL